MGRSVLLIGFCAAAALLVWTQRERPGDRPTYEVKSLMPRAISAARRIWRRPDSDASLPRYFFKRLKAPQR
jgi:hypothetical protein